MAPMLDDAELEEEFALFGIDVKDTNIMDKLKDIAATYSYDVTKIVNCWMAFSKSNDDLVLNMVTLSRFERDHSRILVRTPKTPSNSQVNRFGTPVITRDEISELFGADDTPVSKAGKRGQTTPGSGGKRIISSSGEASIVNASSPLLNGSSASPSSASKKYGQRTGAGEVLCTYGNAAANQSWNGSGALKLSVTNYDPSAALVKPFKYMFQKITDQCMVIDDNIDILSECLMNDLGIAPEDMASASDITQDDVTVIGMVVCDSNGKLNEESVLLQGSRRLSPGAQAYPVSLEAAHSFSLFPGQVVAMKGRNPEGKKFFASEIHTSKPPSLPEVSHDLLNDGLSVVIACGSFTTSDNLAYEPLQDLCKYLIQSRPDICILVGPFLDQSNTESEKLGITYEEHFNLKMNWLVEQTQGLPTHLVVVASHKDLHHDYVYPTAPYYLDGKRRQSDRLHFMSDPCTIVMKGVVFGVTSLDVLFHLSSNEISRNPSNGDRLSRLLGHVLSQQAYYPLYPSHEDVNIDLEHQDIHCRLSVTPHVLIVPSDLKYFVKEINGCVCINPGKLAKGQIGGSFARIIVMPAQGQGVPYCSIVQQSAAQVIRI